MSTEFAESLEQRLSAATARMPAVLIVDETGSSFAAVRSWLTDRILQQYPPSEQPAAAARAAVSALPELSVIDQLWIDGSTLTATQLAASSSFNQRRRVTARAKKDEIGIDDVREILAGLQLRTPAATRAVLIRDASRLTREAGNALLKSLEEPPTGTQYVLTTPTVSALPSTIVSRCALVSVPVACTEELLDAITDIDPTIAASEHWQLAQLARGQIALARRLASDPDVRARRLEQIAEVRDFFAARNTTGRLSAMRGITGRQGALQFVDDCLLFSDQLLRRRAAQPPDPGRRFPPAVVAAVIGTLLDTRRALTSNAHANLTLHALAVSRLLD